MVHGIDLDLGFAVHDIDIDLGFAWGTTLISTSTSYGVQP
jgi:hypothetical protein